MKRIFRESAQNQFGTEDPYFETVPATKMSGTHNTSKLKKRKKALPPGLTAEEELVLVKVKRRAYRLDMALFNCCGMRFGWSSLIALVPAIGDVLDALLAMMVIRTAMQVGLPNDVKAKMVMNVVVDFLIGLVPLIGDIADVMYKANTRNAAILEAYLREKGKKELRKSGLPYGVDNSLPENYVEDEEPHPQDQMVMGNNNRRRENRPRDEEERIEGRTQGDAKRSASDNFRQGPTQKPHTSRQPSSQKPQTLRQDSSQDPNSSRQKTSSRK